MKGFSIRNNFGQSLNGPWSFWVDTSSPTPNAKSECVSILQEFEELQQSAHADKARQQDLFEQLLLKCNQNMNVPEIEVCTHSRMCLSNKRKCPPVGVTPTF